MSHGRGRKASPDTVDHRHRPNKQTISLMGTSKNSIGEKAMREFFVK